MQEVMRNKEKEERFNNLAWSMFELPKILKKERLYRNLSEEDMAEKIGVDKELVISCEKGEVTDLLVIQKYFITLRGYDIIKKAEGQINNYIQKDIKPL